VATFLSLKAGIVADRAWGFTVAAATSASRLADDARKGAKAAKNKKFEARNPKFETNSNDQKKPQNVPNNPVSDSSFWNFLGFLIYLAAVCFGFRASNFEFTFWSLFRISIFGFRIS
jgi:hypothetical protein